MTYQNRTRTVLHAIQPTMHSTLGVCDIHLPIARYRMVVNFRKRFNFAFFASQEPFAKIKTAKISLSTCEVNKLGFNPQPTYTAANRSVSASVPLTAILKLSRKSKCHVSTGTRTRQRCKSESGSNRYYERPWYEATFLATLEQRTEIAIRVFVNNSRHLLSF